MGRKENLQPKLRADSLRKEAVTMGLKTLELGIGRGCDNDVSGINLPVKDLWWVNVGHDTAPGQVVVDDGGVDVLPARKNASLDNRIYNEVVDPFRDEIHLPVRIQFLVAWTAMLHLRPIDVTLSEEVSEKNKLGRND